MDFHWTTVTSLAHPSGVVLCNYVPLLIYDGTVSSQQEIRVLTVGYLP